MNKNNLSINKTFELAVQNQKKGNHGAAKDLYDKILKENPNHASTHCNLGVIFKELGEREKAKSCFEKAIEIQSDHAHAHNNLGKVFEELEQIEVVQRGRFLLKAKSCYEKAIEILPNYSNAHHNLGNVHKRLRKFKEAKNCYEKAIKAQPSHAPSHNNLGLVFQELGEFQKAISCYEKAIQIDPNLAVVHNNLGRVFHELEEIKKAKSCYEKAIEIIPNYAEAHNNLGVVFNELEEFQKSKNCYEKAIQINYNLAAAHHNLGRISKELGEHQKAKSCYEKVIEIDPNHANAHNDLGVVFQELGEVQKATSCYKKAIQIQPNNASAHYNLGNTLKILGEFQEAKNFIQKAIQYEPENLVLYYHLNDITEKILDSNLKGKIDKIMKNVNCTKMNLSYGNFLLSRYASQSKNHEKEFDYLLKGHQFYFETKRKIFETEVDYWLNVLPNAKELFNFNELNTTKDKELKPIFIIGVPRCGSTLVEKVIASGNKYIPIGEETGIFNFYLKQKLLRKESLSRNVENLKTTLVDIYKRKKLISEEADYTFTDKSLDNFFYIGLIKKIFPNAKIIDCRRNVLSCIMSIFKHNLIQLPWTHNLENIFKYFDIYYRMMEQFKKIFPNFIYELKYEKFVGDPNTESKKLLEFCDLPWDKKCLEFYKRKDLISYTISNIQIRRPIYKDSIEKYLPYKKLLSNYGDKYYWFN